MKVEDEDKISFLDTLLIVKRQSLIFDGFRKATFSDRILIFKSFFVHKRSVYGVVYGVVDKIFRLCYSNFQQNNLIEAINILINKLNNGYPLHFIFSSIHNKIKFHIKNISKDKNVNNNKFFTILFVNTISEKFKSIGNIYMLNCKLAFTIPNTLKNFIKRGKDKLEHENNQNVIYKISYDDCDASYVGQTKRQLKTRICEYITDINKQILKILQILIKFLRWLFLTIT